MKNRQNKKTLIVINKGADKLIINPSDLKVVEVVSNGNGNTITIATSVFKHTFSGTNYLVNDKLKPALRDRYNLVTVSESGVSGVESDKNAMVVVKVGDKTTYVFPKALKGVEVDGHNIVIHAFKQTLTVPVGRQINATELQLFPVARLEKAVVGFDEEET